MARLNVNPTRMELKRLKASLSTAKRGHKLLKDKSDEMIRRFSVLIKENKRLRDLVEGELSGALRQFSMASGLTGKEQLEKAFSMPAVGVEADYKTKSIMGVVVPDISVKEERRSGLPYAFAGIWKTAATLVDETERAARLKKVPSMLVEQNSYCISKKIKLQYQTTKKSTA